MKYSSFITVLLIPCLIRSSQATAQHNQRQLYDRVYPAVVCFPRELVWLVATYAATYAAPEGIFENFFDKKTGKLDMSGTTVARCFGPNVRIGKLNRTAFAGALQAVTHLDASNNQMSEIAPGTLTPLARLTELRLNGNCLSKVPSDLLDLSKFPCLTFCALHDNPCVVEDRKNYLALQVILLERNQSWHRRLLRAIFGNNSCSKTIHG